MKTKTIQIKVTEDEERYAKELSLRSIFKCPRPKEGSVAHGFKTLLHEQARADGVDIECSDYFKGINGVVKRKIRARLSEHGVEIY